MLTIHDLCLDAIFALFSMEEGRSSLFPAFFQENKVYSKESAAISSAEAGSV